MNSGFMVALVAGVAIVALKPLTAKLGLPS